MKTPFPVIAAITGHAFAGGALLAMACDWRVMGKTKGFICFNEVVLGSPFPRSFHTLLKAKASPKAYQALFNGHRFNAEEGVSHGIVN